MHGSQVSQARRKFHVGSGLQPASLIGVQPRSLDSCPLTRDPVQMPEPERRGFSARAVPWDGDSHAAVAIHAQQISPGALVTDEVELSGGRYEGCEGHGGCERVCVIAQWKAQLHGDRIAERGGLANSISQPEQPGSKPTRPRRFQNAVAVTASVLWGTEGLDSGYDQPGFGRKKELMQTAA